MVFKAVTQPWVRRILVGGLTLASLGSVAFGLVQARLSASVPKSTGFVSAKDAKDLRLMPLPVGALPKGLERPKGGTRGIICKPSQAARDCDDRVPMLDRGAPWSAIGRIVRQDQDGQRYQCTGTLIGEDLILTNAHCVISPKTHQVYRGLTFEPNVVDGVLKSPKDRAMVVGGVYGTDFRDKATPPHPQDWAIARLDRSLGKTYGVMKWRSLSMSVLRENPKKLTLVGYSVDFPNLKKFPNLKAGEGNTAGKHERCSVVRERADRVLIHDCDMRGGASGGPIMGWIDNEPYIVALNSAEFANQKTGIGTENYATNLVQVEEWLKQQRATGQK
jgi:protease YdgD